MSGKYKIRLHRKVLEVDTKERIKKKCIELLSHHPSEIGEPLRYELSGYRKLKVFSDYRVVYRVNEAESIVYIIAIGIRRSEEVFYQAKKRI